MSRLLEAPNYPRHLAKLIQVKKKVNFFKNSFLFLNKSSVILLHHLRINRQKTLFNKLL